MMNRGLAWSGGGTGTSEAEAKVWKAAALSVLLLFQEGGCLGWLFIDTSQCDNQFPEWSLRHWSWDDIGMTLQVSSSHGKELQGSCAVLPPPPPEFPFQYHFPRGVCKTFIHFKRCYGKFPSGSFLSGRDKYYSLQKSGLLTWKPNNWGWRNGQEAAHRGNPFWLHLSCCRTLGCRRGRPSVWVAR